MKGNKNPLPRAFVRGLLLGTMIFLPLTVFRKSEDKPVHKVPRSLIAVPAEKAKPSSEWRKTHGKAEWLGVWEAVDPPKPIQPRMIQRRPSK